MFHSHASTYTHTCMCILTSSWFNRLQVLEGKCKLILRKSFLNIRVFRVTLMFSYCGSTSSYLTTLKNRGQSNKLMPEIRNWQPIGI